MDYILNDEKLTGWESSFSSHSWFKKDKYGVEWQAYQDDVSGMMQFRTVSDRLLGLNSPMTRNFFQELFHD